MSVKAGPAHTPQHHVQSSQVSEQRKSVRLLFAHPLLAHDTTCVFCSCSICHEKNLLWRMQGGGRH